MTPHRRLPTASHWLRLLLVWSVAASGLLTAAGFSGLPYAWGSSSPSSIPEEATNLIALDASILGPIALRSDGTVVAWDGSPSPPPGLSNVVAISAGGVFHLALRRDGRAIAWGRADHVSWYSILTPPPWLTNVVAISAGYDHSTALTADGYLISWGSDRSGLVNGPFRPLRPRSFSAGQQQTLGVDDSGKIFGWGSDNYGAFDFPRSLDNAIQISVGPYQHVVALQADGRVAAWGNDSDGQTRVPATATNVIQVVAGSLWSLALRRDGSVVAWGQSGAPTVQPPPDPIKFFSIAAGRFHNFGLTRAPINRATFEAVSLPAGSALDISRAIICSDSYTIQWQRDGSPIPGATNPVLRLPDAQSTDAGTYTLVATNEFGGSLSAGFVVTVTPTTPKITVPPESIGVPRGKRFSLSVLAVGSSPISYQWQFNGSSLPQGTNATLDFPNTGSADDGEYRVIVSNSLGTVSSRPIQLSTGLPAFTQQPLSFHGLLGRPIKLEAALVTPETPALQWWRNGSALSNGHSLLLEFGPIHPEDTGEYWLTASNSFGSVTSRIAIVSIREPRRPLSEPHAAIHSLAGLRPFPETFNQVIDAAMMATTGNAYGIGIRPDRTLVLWGTDLVIPSGMTPPTGLSNVVAILATPLHTLALTSEGTVRAWRTTEFDDYGQANTPAGLSGVVEIAATYYSGLALQRDGEVVSWPINWSVPPGLHGVSAISASGNSNSALREDGTIWFWEQFSPQNAAVSAPMDALEIATGENFVAVLRRNGDISRFTRDGILDLPKLPDGSPAVEIATLSGAILVRTAEGRVWKFPVWGGTAWREWIPGLSPVARVTGGYETGYALTLAPYLVTPPASTNVSWGGNGRLSVDVRSASPAAYQWRRGGAPLPGQTRAELQFSPAVYQDDGSYDVVVSNQRFAVTSAPARLTVSGPPEVGGPVAQPAAAGSDVRLTPVVRGPGPFKYQWYFNNQPIPRSSGASLLLADVQSGAVGNYYVEVSNTFGTRRGPEVRVQVLPSAPVITQPLANQSILEGSRAIIAVAAQGTRPLRYQWFLNNQMIAGATNAALSWSAISPTDAGTYQVQIHNDLGSTQSDPVQLLVGPTAPVFLEVQPWNLANVGAQFQFSPGRAGSTPIIRQWRKDGLDIPGQTNTTLTFDSLVRADAGIYTLYQSNRLGYAESDPLRLVVRPGTGIGAVVTWGRGQSPQNYGMVQDLAMASTHTLGVRLDGTVQTWLNAPSDFLQTPEGLTNVVSVACGPSFSIALHSDGTLTAWGDPNHGGLNFPAGLRRIVAIAAGTSHAVALQEDGVPVTWGTIMYGKTNAPPAATNLVAISSQSSQILGLRRDGRVVSWGLNDSPTVPDNITNLVAIAAAPFGGLGLTSDLRPVAWGSAPRPQFGLTNLLAIASGESHGLGVHPNGTVVGFGSNSYGESVPTPGLSNVLSVMASQAMSAALTRAPVLVPLPYNITALKGTIRRLAPEAYGFPPLNYQWFRNGVELTGETNLALVSRLDEQIGSAKYELRASNPWQTVFVRTTIKTVGPVELRWRALAPGKWGLNARADGSDFVVLQQSSNLRDWKDIFTFSIRSGGADLQLPGSFEFEANNYRLWLP